MMGTNGVSSGHARPNHSDSAAVRHGGLAGTSGGTTSPSALIIRGVTLIDGNGGAPLANATVVVEGTRITRVSVGTVRSRRACKSSTGAGSSSFQV
jgi:hypothetical protein